MTQQNKVVFLNIQCIPGKQKPRRSRAYQRIIFLIADM
ncbi:hypothetical Protein YC6258_01462 [Gynuella sunshinyii YC6258]|uniref:Uncharacterized protein n=1 Tax=Gynuella sunshinyii YC6258 TaxID=1445510 RepID=A0A0C5VH02_9GAMM|nr:hypothetical Protein YC6258_01462 [Gynuella sunshinyii YC6258]